MGCEKGAYSYFDMSRSDKGYADFVARRTGIHMPPTFAFMRLKQLQKEWDLHCYNRPVTQSQTKFIGNYSMSISQLFGGK